MSIRLGVLLPEVEKLPVSVIAEYISVLNTPADEKTSVRQPTGDVESDLMAMFGGPK